MIGKTLLQKLRKLSPPKSQRATALLLLCCGILLTGCAGDIKQGQGLSNFPASLFDPGTPGIVQDPATATQADAATAYAKTYAAWDQCSANMGAAKGILEGAGMLEPATEKTHLSANSLSKNGQ